MGNSNFLTMNIISKQDRKVIERLVEKYGIEILNETSLGKKLLPYICAGILAMAPNSFNENPRNHRVIQTEVETGTIPQHILQFLEHQKEIAEKYISENLQRNGRSIDDVKFDIMDLVMSCYENDYDLPLMLAQLQVESHFGTDGQRQEDTKSIFSVGLHDNGKNYKNYKSYKEAIDDYINLMKTQYFQNGKVTIDQLLKNFVDGQNRRYASDPNYKSSVRRTRNSIIRKHPDLAAKPI